MANLEEIEAAITRLAPQDYQQLVAWFHERDQQEWDTQMDQDASSGKLDFVRLQAREARDAGLTRDWPTSK